MMRIPLGTVKSRLHRARLVLREMLTPHMSALMSRYRIKQHLPGA
jgi:DNA-directed RNA polymerase specialized sigma24 family protein